MYDCFFISVLRRSFYAFAAATARTIEVSSYRGRNPTSSTVRAFVWIRRASRLLGHELMRVTSLRGTALAAVCALAAWSCEAVSPASPSALTAAPGAAGRLFEETPAPAADPVPPVTATISIIGAFGEIAFLPNPVQAAIGNMVVWINDDVRIHHIVLDDGTDLGAVMPGETSAPLPLATADPIGYHCTLHPSMVGSINGMVAPPPPPPEPDPYYPSPPYEPDPYY
jgi:plastocyanin